MNLRVNIYKKKVGIFIEIQHDLRVSTFQMRIAVKFLLHLLLNLHQSFTQTHTNTYTCTQRNV